MSKIVVEFDTVGKTMVATIDGATVENVCGAHFYGDWDGEKYCCEVCTCQTDKENGMSTYTRVMASEMAEAKELKDFLVHDELPGFKIVNKTSKRISDELIGSVASFFGVKVEKN